LVGGFGSILPRRIEKVSHLKIAFNTMMKIIPVIRSAVNSVHG